MEAALILPIIVLLAMGLIEFSSAELQDSQATSAARDGARVGILDYRQADVGGSAAHDAVVDATKKRVTGQDPDVAVRCIDPGGAAIICGDARPDVDRIEVAASWDYQSVTAFGFGVPSKIVGVSRMAIVGRPITTPPPPTTTTSTSTTTTSSTSSTTTTTAPSSGCSVVSTPTVDWGGSGGGAGSGRNNAGTLKKPLTFSDVRVSGNLCGTPTIRIWPGSTGKAGTSIDRVMAATGLIWSTTFPDGQDAGWTSGTKTFQVLDGSGASIAEYTFVLP